MLGIYEKMKFSVEIEQSRANWKQNQKFVLELILVWESF